ncbi:50S ribosomal protein L29 [Saccharicrinis fermentans]|uniref:Large ribosomal subunit protein uL29 n=1 Tax=Saccharicrinis fermentans DSM 9555 = JCM 21142 TaxID=869213 RepID=W7XWF0_9BACT|nr:50S ribosomal protein L29 [Saccharicrinis fermentans]GAF02615.1 50S ribosomal protein L29 [Saccharicrinis fermentans DSM 9555 = JCM 21142]
MKVSEINEMAISEIIERIDTERAELIRLELNHSISPLENPLQIRDLRRNIARLQTILRQKQLTEK